jgi:hypothetical protein
MGNFFQFTRQASRQMASVDPSGGLVERGGVDVELGKRGVPGILGYCPGQLVR